MDAWKFIILSCMLDIFHNKFKKKNFFKCKSIAGLSRAVLVLEAGEHPAVPAGLPSLRWLLSIF